MNERILKPYLNNGYYKFCLHKYGKSKVIKRSVLMAIVFLGHKQNGWKIVVDHINNISIDDRLENLQLITNRVNCSKDKKKCSSKYVGVSWHKINKKWRAQIRINGKSKNLGSFTNELKASNAYKTALKQL